MRYYLHATSRASRGRPTTTSPLLTAPERRRHQLRRVRGRTCIPTPSPLSQRTPPAHPPRRPQPTPMGHEQGYSLDPLPGPFVPATAHTGTHTHTRTRAHAHMHTRTYAHTHTRTHAHTHTRTHAHTHTRTHAHTRAVASVPLASTPNMDPRKLGTTPNDTEFLPRHTHTHYRPASHPPTRTHRPAHLGHERTLEIQCLRRPVRLGGGGGSGFSTGPGDCRRHVRHLTGKGRRPGLARRLWQHSAPIHARATRTAALERALRSQHMQCRTEAGRHPQHSTKHNSRDLAAAPSAAAPT